MLIAVTTYIQYNATFLSTYVESGVRRITLAEKLRKIPLSFFGKKDLSDLDEYDHGGLRPDGNGFLALHPGAGRCLHFDGPGGDQPVFL